MPSGAVRGKDGSIYDPTKGHVFVAVDTFIANAKNPQLCFLCAVELTKDNLAVEHVIPSWVQNLAGIRDKFIKLLNGSKISYTKLIVPCCKDCNHYLNVEFEVPISRIFRHGADAVSKFISEGGSWKLFQWVNLLFLKTHIKDNYLRLDKNLRVADTMVGDVYDWELLHHSHAIARAGRFDIPIDKQSVCGSFMGLNLTGWNEEDKYDYNDQTYSSCVFVRINDYAIIAVLNDGGGTLQGLEPKLEKLPAGLNRIQLAELLSEFQFISFHLKYRPKFMTIFDRSERR